MTEEFNIRIQLIALGPGDPVRVVDSFIVEPPKRVWGVQSTYAEAPFLVAQAFYERLKKGFSK